ncbi:hypothetical protein JQK62_24585, partial [Leptospira santarosai]|nr:hypothetical protein [Leptospira santarosai]
ALGYSPNEGPGLVFIILPAVFEQIPFGAFFMLLFFILMLFATLTSSIAMLETVVSMGIKMHMINGNVLHGFTVCLFSLLVYQVLYLWCIFRCQDFRKNFL